MNLLGSLHGRLSVALLLLLGTLWTGALTHTRHLSAERALGDIDDRLKSSVSRLFQVIVLVERSGRALDRGAASRLLPAAAPVDGEYGTLASRLPSFEIVWDDGHAPMRSVDFPTLATATAAGFEDHAVEERTWRVLTVADPARGVTGRVALDDSVRDALATQMNRDAVRPLLWILPLFAIVALVSVWHGLAPLRKLERFVGGQEPLALQHLDIDPSGMPLELRRLVTVIEGLLARLRGILSRQREFTAAAGHELRTPLAGCRIQLQVAQRSRDAASRERALAQAQRSIDAMDRLVGQLLILARADAEVAEVPKRCVDIAALVADAVASRERASTTAGVTIRFRRDSPNAYVLGNATLIECMALNLIDNAIKFSPPGSEVGVTVATEADRVLLRVLDRGPGIPGDARERVFDPFHRADESSRSGSGLGLTIVRAVVTDHDGQVRLDAPREGGNEAVVTLPASNRASAR